ncbi:FMN-binding protein [Alloalcanivorax sp. C16-2]|uniref:FMN-binding protein n=1 Tax=Alloalcanivorax sp. C16-2 TaxID=3390052 RepID=UPI003970ED08
MPDLNPLSLWRKLLALPNESRAKTLAVAFLVSAVCTVIVSATAVILDPVQQANRRAEQAARMDAMLAAMPDMAALIERTGGDELETLIIDLRTGEPARDVAPDTLDVEHAFSDPVSTTPLDPERDLAGLGERPDLVPIHVLREDGRLRLVILPVVTQGYQSTIRANLALEGDLQTVAAFSIVEQGETPGLGARIDDPAWQARWRGKRVAGPDGQLRLSVVRGGGTDEFQVEGITGATRTGNAINNGIQFWLGPDGFGPVLERLAKDGR